MNNEEALRLMEECAGTQFDPAIIEVFTKLPVIRQRRDFPIYTEETGVPLRQLAEVVDSEDALSIIVREEQKS